MDETAYNRLADEELDRIEAALEPAYASGALDELERDGSVLTIQPKGAPALIVSKHGPSRQIWLASSRLGGLHFTYNQSWKLADGRELLATIKSQIGPGVAA